MKERRAKECRRDLKSNSNWEDRAGERERGEIAGLRRGRKCRVMLGWATTGGFPGQAVWAIHPFSRTVAPLLQSQLPEISYFQAISHANKGRWQTSTNCTHFQPRKKAVSFFYKVCVHVWGGRGTESVDDFWSDNAVFHSWGIRKEISWASTQLTFLSLAEVTENLKQCSVIM